VEEEAEKPILVNAIQQGQRRMEHR